jgi:hypothetical protein
VWRLFVSYGDECSILGFARKLPALSCTFPAKERYPLLSSSGYAPVVNQFLDNFSLMVVHIAVANIDSHLKCVIDLFFRIQLNWKAVVINWRPKKSIYKRN